MRAPRSWEVIRRLVPVRAKAAMQVLAIAKAPTPDRQSTGEDVESAGTTVLAGRRHRRRQSDRGRRTLRPQRPSVSWARVVCYWAGVQDVTANAVAWLPAGARRWVAPLLRIPPLRPWRIGGAFAVAVAVDVAQLILGPMGWSIADEVLDLLAMVLTSWLLGFHVLLLPTFALETLPVVDMLPTWTGCVGIVVARRRHQARTENPSREGPRDVKPIATE